MAKKVESIKHPKDKRVHIPSKEEAGYEDANPKVKQGKKLIELPKNPVVHRGQDPELFWLDKYGNDDRDELLRVDIRSLYRHEHIAPETLIENLYRMVAPSPSGRAGEGLQLDFSSMNELFGNALEKDELEKVSDYYQHQDGWTNRLIQGDSHLVMASLLEREGMAGQVQTIYIDPPYGIKYGSNWQVRMNNRDVKDGNDEFLSGEGEVIKAFRDTWADGVHSYLSYLRDRLLIAKELLTESGSCFVQISDENVHLVRSIMDEVFGSENFVSLIYFQTTRGFESQALSRIGDFIVWFAKDKAHLKYRQIYEEIKADEGEGSYNWILLPDGQTRSLSKAELENPKLIPADAKRYQPSDFQSSGETKSDTTFEYNGKIYKPNPGKHWKTNLPGMKKLAELKRIHTAQNSIRYMRFHEDFPFRPINNVWQNVNTGNFLDEKQYVVQTTAKVLQRCLLMTTDPGDLILDPTCGSGTTAFVAEQFGRRWITIDTSRIALNIAKQRLMTATYPYYKLYDEPPSNSPKGGERQPDIRQGFIYKTVPHITLKSLANDEPPSTETLYDKPEIDNKRLRVSGPFTVETLQNFEPISPEALDSPFEGGEGDVSQFEEVIKQHLLSAGIKNGRKNEMVVFTRVELLANEHLHAEGFYMNGKGEKKAYFFIGPKFGTVSKKQVNDAIKECRNRGDAQWLVILGFSFESDIEGSTQTTSMGTFEVTKARIHDDLLQEGLKKKPSKSAASFVTIGEPDILLVDSGWWLVDRNKQILCNYDIIKKLSGLDSLAKINGLNQTDLSAYIILSQRRDVWINFSNEKSSSKHSGKHIGGTGTEHNVRVSSILGDSERFFGGIADFDNVISELELSDERKFRSAVKQLHGDSKVIEWTKELSVAKELTTNHYSQTTILGLDIYDPIKDEVKARNVSDIAYWMVDDDYDGSNFIVKQVFFCGGDKSEFDKWKKGLSDIAKQDTKRKAEKTLKVEIDDDAFDRLYGHISHPIEIKKKGQKIAVRVISQFGEETMKVLAV